MGYMDVGYWNGTERFDHYGPHQRLHLRSIKMIADGTILTMSLISPLIPMQAP